MLQGTLDVFSLDEVLGLLASAKKTGALRVTGDRGSGSLGLRDGTLVGGSADLASGDNDITDALFELLRFSSGSFEFDSTEAITGDDEVQLAGALASAHERLVEWKAIEAVVPSLHHIVKLVPELGAPQTTIDASEWAALVMIGDGATVGHLGGRLGLGEVDGSRRVKGIVERGLVTLNAPDFAPSGDLPSRTAAPIPAAPSIDSVDTSGVIDDAVPVVMAETAPPLPSRRSEDAATERATFNSVMPDEDDMAAFEMAAAESIADAAPPVEEAEIADTAADASSDESATIESGTIESGTDESSMIESAKIEPAAIADVPPAPPAPDAADGSLLMRYLKSNG